MTNDSPAIGPESSGLSSRMDGNILRLEFAAADGINVLDDSLFDALERELMRAEDKPEVRVVLLSGRGKMFCVGAKLQRDASALMPEGYARSALYRAVLRLLAFPKPIVAAVHGAAIGGGVTLLMHCDFVVAAEETRFQLPFAQLGIPCELASAYLLPMSAGSRLASELIMLAMPFGPDTALRAGIINEVVAPERTLDRAYEYARRLIRLSPSALRASKRLIRHGHQAALLSVLEAEMRALEAGLRSDDFANASAAFLDGREPDFTATDRA